MRGRGAGSAPRLLIAADWGHAVALDTDTGAELALEVTLDTADPSAALGLADRWRELHNPALAGAIRAELGVRSGGQARVLRLACALPRGSHLGEVVPRARPTSAALLGSLWLDAVRGVLEAHAAKLCCGNLQPELAFLCPPGADGVATVRLHAVGLPLIVALARGALPVSDASAWGQLFGIPEVVAPEVLEGQAPTAGSDTYSLCALVAWTALHRHVHAAPTAGLVRHLAGRGPVHEDLEALDTAVPNLGSVIGRGMASTPWARAGALADLAACLQAACEGRPTQLVEGVRVLAPWAIGSALVPLAAYAGAARYEDRFGPAGDAVAVGARSSSAKVARVAAAMGAAVDPGGAMGAAPVPGTGDPRVRAALARLDAERDLSRARAEQRGRNLLARLVLVTVLCLIAFVIAAIGIHRTERMERSFREAERVRSAPPPAPPPPRPAPRVLFESNP
ncbi:MAG: hypothetical protein EXR79_08560 [Myxococcales bacterium]|nr:hypothetical protein [Myxococcales bacterium]